MSNLAADWRQRDTSWVCCLDSPDVTNGLPIRCTLLGGFSMALNSLLGRVYGHQIRAHSHLKWARFDDKIQSAIDGFFLEGFDDREILWEKSRQSHSGFWRQNGSTSSGMGPNLVLVYPP